MRQPCRRQRRNGAALPLRDGESASDLLERFHRPFFDREFESVVTSKTPGPGRDILEASANNLYVGVSWATSKASTSATP